MVIQLGGDRHMAKSGTYALWDKGKKVYIGVSEDPEARAKEHREEGKRFDRVEVTSRPMKTENAEKREEEQLAAYRRGHAGKNPKYNKTDK